MEGEDDGFSQVKSKKHKKKERKRQREEEQKSAALQQSSSSSTPQSVKRVDSKALGGVIDNASYVAIFGGDVRGSVTLKPEYRGKLFLNHTHLQSLVGVTMGTTANASTSPFVVCHGALLRQCVMISLAGVTLQNLEPALRERFHAIFPAEGRATVHCPGSFTKVFPLPAYLLRLRVPVPADQRKKKPEASPAQLHELLATEEQLRENEYPMVPGPDDVPSLPEFVVAQEQNDKAYAMLALDCEMVTTEVGMELGRLSVLDANGAVLMDTFVAPVNPVQDYNTQYSGLTESLLEGAPSLLEVREKFLALISRDTVLVGHSLENDLRVLRVVHKKICDTALLYPHNRGNRFKKALRELSSTYLSLKIQGKKEGHDSTEDALAALKLVQLKMEKGLMFGVNENQFQSIWETVRDKSGCLLVLTENADTLRSVIQEGIGAASVIAVPALNQVTETVLKQNASGAVFTYVALPDLTCTPGGRVQEDAEVIGEKVERKEEEVSAVVINAEVTGATTNIISIENNNSNINSNVDNNNNNNNNNSVDGPNASSAIEPVTPTRPVDPLRSQEGYVSLVEAIYNGLRPGTLFVVHGGRGSIDKLRTMQEQQVDERTMADEALKIRAVPFFMCSK